jgi:hypothetical protein
LTFATAAGDTGAFGEHGGGADGRGCYTGTGASLSSLSHPLHRQRFTSLTTPLTSLTHSRIGSLSDGSHHDASIPSQSFVVAEWAKHDTKEDSKAAATEKAGVALLTHRLRLDEARADQAAHAHTAELLPHAMAVSVCGWLHQQREQSLSYGDILLKRLLQVGSPAPCVRTCKHDTEGVVSLVASKDTLHFEQPALSSGT